MDHEPLPSVGRKIVRKTPKSPAGLKRKNGRRWDRKVAPRVVKRPQAGKVQRICARISQIFKRAPAPPAQNKKLERGLSARAQEFPRVAPPKPPRPSLMRSKSVGAPERRPLFTVDMLWRPD